MLAYLFIYLLIHWNSFVAIKYLSVQQFCVYHAALLVCEEDSTAGGYVTSNLNTRF